MSNKFDLTLQKAFGEIVAELKPAFPSGIPSARLVNRLAAIGHNLTAQEVIALMSTLTPDALTESERATLSVKPVPNTDKSAQSAAKAPTSDTGNKTKPNVKDNAPKPADAAPTGVDEKLVKNDGNDGKPDIQVLTFKQIHAIVPLVAEKQLRELLELPAGGFPASTVEKGFGPHKYTLDVNALRQWGDERGVLADN